MQHLLGDQIAIVLDKTNPEEPMDLSHPQIGPLHQLLLKNPSIGQEVVVPPEELDLTGMIAPS